MEADQSSEIRTSSKIPSLDMSRLTTPESYMRDVDDLAEDTEAQSQSGSDSQSSSGFSVPGLTEEESAEIDKR